MTLSGEERHALYLHNLCHHLDYIDIKHEDTSFVLKEPIWWQRDSRDIHSLCDLVIGYSNNTTAGLELKGNKKKRSKAIHQLEAGKEFIEDYLHHEYSCGIFAVYIDVGQYYYEVYDPDFDLVRKGLTQTKK